MGEVGVEGLGPVTIFCLLILVALGLSLCFEFGLFEEERVACHLAIFACLR